MVESCEFYKSYFLGGLLVLTTWLVLTGISILVICPLLLGLSTMVIFAQHAAKWAGCLRDTRGRSFVSGIAIMAAALLCSYPVEPNRLNIAVPLFGLLLLAGPIVLIISVGDLLKRRNSFKVAHKDDLDRCPPTPESQPITVPIKAEVPEFRISTLELPRVGTLVIQTVARSKLLQDLPINTKVHSRALAYVLLMTSNVLEKRPEEVARLYGAAITDEHNQELLDLFREFEVFTQVHPRSTLAEHASILSDSLPSFDDQADLPSERELKEYCRILRAFINDGATFNYHQDRRDYAIFLRSAAYFLSGDKSMALEVASQLPILPGIMTHGSESRGPFYHWLSSLFVGTSEEPVVPTPKAATVSFSEKAAISLAQVTKTQLAVQERTKQIRALTNKPSPESPEAEPAKMKRVRHEDNSAKDDVHAKGTIDAQKHLRVMRAESAVLKTTYENLLRRLFEEAVVAGDIDVLCLLIHRGAEPNQKLTSGFCLAHRIVELGDYCDKRRLMVAGLNINVESSTGITPLSLEVLSNRSKNFVMLALLGADFNHESSIGMTALTWAAYTGSLEMIRELVAYGSRVNHETANGTTALIWAVMGNHRDAVELLLELGAAREFVTREGLTAGRCGEFFERWEVVELSGVK